MPGVDFREEIERQLGKVKCVVVSVVEAINQSRFRLLDEAGYAMERKVLLACGTLHLKRIR